MKESSFWEGLRKAWKGKGLFQRIETLTAPGVPDVFACVNGKNFWIELKAHDKHGRIELTGHQLAWRKMLLKNGGNHVTLTRDIEGMWLDLNGEIIFIRCRPGAYSEVLDTIMRSIK